jgi:hypothetical protein
VADPNQVLCMSCDVGKQPKEGQTCVCANGYYNSSAGANPIKCFADREPWSSLPTAAVETDCLPCADTSCSDDAISCVDGVVLLQPGFAVSETSAIQEVPLNDMTGQRSIYACDISGACLGDPQSSETEQGGETPRLTTCSAAYDGPLCDYCAEGYSRPGFTGKCTECSEGLATAHVIGGGLVAIVVMTAMLYWVSSTHAETGKLAVMHTLGKIAISLAQVLTQLEFSLSVTWPATFRWFIDLLKLFSMDLLGFLDIGCVTQYTYTSKFTFAMLLAPIMLLGVLAVYQLRKGADGIANRCIKMALLVLFLVYPFVSQTVFQ